MLQLSIVIYQFLGRDLVVETKYRGGVMSMNMGKGQTYGLQICNKTLA